MKILSGPVKSHYFLLKLASLLMVLSMGCQNSNEPSFGLIGDLPYSKSEEQGFEDLIKNLNKQKLSFVVHVGDFKSQNQPCQDDVYQLRLKQYHQTSNPLIIEKEIGIKATQINVDIIIDRLIIAFKVL